MESSIDDVDSDILDAMVPAKKVHVVGRRWSSRTYGTTYHAVTVYVNDEDGVEIPMRCGYGDSYEETALEFLESRGRVPHRPESGRVPPWQWYSQNGIEYTRRAYDVKRQRDL